VIVHQGIDVYKDVIRINKFLRFSLNINLKKASQKKKTISFIYKCEKPEFLFNITDLTI